MGVCDGLYQPYLSSDIKAAAWRVEDPVTKCKMEGTVPCSGMEDEIGSYRAELQGCHALLLGVKAFCLFHGIDHGKLCIGFDDLLGTKRSKDDCLRVPPKFSHTDLIHGIHTTHASLPIDTTINMFMATKTC